MSSYKIFILSHNRPHNIPTVKTLAKNGIVDGYVLVIDDKDPKLSEYLEIYGDKNLIIFSKEFMHSSTDTLDNFHNLSSDVYARQAIFDYAKNNRVENFLMLDDDYTEFRFRFQDGTKLAHSKDLGGRLTDIFQLFFDYLNKTSITTLALSQGGDFIGGISSGLFKSKTKRKSMNVFFCRGDRPIGFIGTMNADVNTYISEGKVGKIHLTVRDFSVEQEPTQSGGAMSEAYKRYGTYLKSFYSVMCRPDCVKCSVIGPTNKRIHHKINWDTCVPMIISDQYKKEKQQ